jgi:hypothetical protein
MLDIPTACRRFNTWLVENSNWLLIFDNVLQVNDVLDFLPSRGHGHVLFTTRSEFIAGNLTPSKELAVEIPTLQQAQGEELVHALCEASRRPISATDTEARQVCEFASGLPLAIEQIVQLAVFQQETLAATLCCTRNKQEFLKQRHPSSFHEHNLSTGAIVSMSLEALQRRLPQASALFKVMCYLQPSSIPRALLESPDQCMDDYFARGDTFTRGAIRTSAAQSAYTTSKRKVPFRLWDYDPWDPALYSHLACAIKDSSRRRVNLPGGDSRHDESLRRQWQDDPSSPLRLVFSSPVQMNAALLEIRELGLARLIESETLWIHDLFADLTVAYITTIEGIEANASAAHFAATMVFLALPPAPVLFTRSAEQCVALLPHADSTLGHLRNAKILADVAVGAELSYQAACATWLSGYYSVFTDAINEEDGSREPGRSTKEATTAALRHYQEAYRGYAAAEQRARCEISLKHGQQRVHKRLQRIMWADWELEDTVQMLGKGARMYTPLRHIRGFERFGNTATRRKLDAAVKIGIMYRDLNKGSEARHWLMLAKIGYEMYFGKRHMETVAVINVQAEVAERDGNLDGAVRCYEELFWSVQGDDDRQMDLLRQMARCWEVQGRHREALVALELVYDWCQVDKEHRWVGCGVAVARDLAELSASLSRWEGAVGWWCQYWDLLLREKGCRQQEGELEDIDIERPGWWLRGDDKWRGGAMADLQDAYAHFQECLLNCEEQSESQASSGSEDSERSPGRLQRLRQLSDKTVADVDAWMQRLRGLTAEAAARETDGSEEETLVEARKFNAEILRSGHESGLSAVWC